MGGSEVMNVTMNTNNCDLSKEGIFEMGSNRVVTIDNNGKADNSNNN